MEAMRVRPVMVLVFCAVLVLSWSQIPVCHARYWTEPVPLVEVNSESHDKSPFLSFDGLTLYFSVEPGWGFTHIYQAERLSPTAPFDMIREISTLNYASGHVDYPWVSPDNLRMYYYRTEVGGKRLRVTERSPGRSYWPAGRGIAELNRLGDVANPTLTQDERIIVFSGNALVGGKGQWDLWMANRPDRDAPFTNVRNLDTVNSGASDMHPYITPDGLTLYFGSNRNDTFQLFRAARMSLDSPFGSPEHLVMFDTPDGDSYHARLAADGKTFLFCRREKNETMDIYVSYLFNSGDNRVELVRAAEAGEGQSIILASTTIQEAIDAAQDGDTVNVYPGVYREAIRFAGKAITVRSAGDAAILEAPGAYAVSFQSGEGPDSVLKNLVIRSSRVGIMMTDSSPTISNVTVVGNECGAQAIGAADPSISDSIFWYNTWSDLFACQAVYSCVERGAEGPGNFSEDPLFADPDLGDYHLLSTRGRYWPEQDVWVLDDVTSLCVDAGDPDADFSCEREPNGGRVNVGAYGGTAFASMSEPLLAAGAND